MDTTIQATLINSLAILRHQESLAGLVGAVETLSSRIKSMDARLDKIEAMLDRDEQQG